MTGNTPRPGDFGVRRIPGWGGFLIRVGQWLNGGGFADYEHAFIVADDHRVIEARPGGAGYAPIPSWARYYRCPDTKRGLVVLAATDLIGTPYSWADYFALAALRLRLPLASRLLGRYVASTGHMICSQFVDACYTRAGISLFPDGRQPGDVTPADLFRLITTQPVQPPA